MIFLQLLSTKNWPGQWVVKTNRINVILFLLTAVAAVLAMKVAGIMLVSAMLILPPLTALQLSVSFRMTILAAACFQLYQSFVALFWLFC